MVVRQASPCCMVVRKAPPFCMVVRQAPPCCVVVRQAKPTDAVASTLSYTPSLLLPSPRLCSLYGSCPPPPPRSPSQVPGLSLRKRRGYVVPEC